MFNPAPHVPDTRTEQMMHLHRSRGPAAALALAACSPAGSGSSPASTPTSTGSCPTTPLDVVVSVDQWGDIVQDLGGDCATVHIVLASSSVDPHDYEPTSADAVVFDTAQLVGVNGADYDLWASDLASNAASSPAVVDAGRSSAPPRARIRACGIRRGM